MPSVAGAGPQALAWAGGGPAQLWSLGVQNLGHWHEVMSVELLFKFESRTHTLRYY